MTLAKKYLKKHIKNFDLISFLNFMKFLNVTDFSCLTFQPNVSLKSNSSIFENIIFESNEIIIFLNFPISVNLKLLLNKINIKNTNLYGEIINKISKVNNIMLLNIINPNVTFSVIYNNKNFTLCYMENFIKNLFHEYKIKVKFKYTKSFGNFYKPILTIGKKTNKTNDYSNHTQTIKLYCDILIYTDNNLSVIELKKQFSQKLKLLKVNNQISFKIIHIKSFNNIYINKKNTTLNTPIVRLPFFLDANYHAMPFLIN